MRLQYIVMLPFLLFTAGCAGQPMRVSLLEPISLTTLVEDPVRREAMDAAIASGEEVVVRFEAGQSIPFTLQLDTPAAALQPGTLELVFKREMFLRIAREEQALSADGRRWTPLRDLAGLRTLLGVGGGKMTLAITPNEEDGLAMSFTLQGRESTPAP